MGTIRAICLGLTFLAAFACATSVAAAEPEPGEAGWLYDPGQVVAIDLTLSPAAEAELEAAFAQHTSARELLWVQEEPANMGALNFLAPQLERLAR